MTPGEREILDRAGENIQAAKLLARQGYYAIAASRGYYALFYIAEALLIRRKLHFSSHSAVIAAYGKEFAKSGELDPKFHQYLIKSQEIRQTSDYNFAESISESDVEQIITWAEEFAAAAEMYLTRAV